MDFTAENLEKAVALFYRTEVHQQAEAHRWLTEAQNSPQAWSFVWELLNPHKSSEVQFFAATTLHTKLMKNWNEVPEDHYELLKKRILEAIINYATGPRIILNRLCITLSAYIIHTVPMYWPEAFEELVSSFQPQHLPNVEPERVIWILLEILTVIPEEFQSTTLAVNQRSRVRSVLDGVSKDIMKVVEMCLMPLPNTGFDMSNLTTYLNASRCASAWLQLGGLHIDQCTSIINTLIDLTCFVYWNKSDATCLAGDELDLIEVTVEALTAIIEHPQTGSYRNHVKKYAAQILLKFEKILEVECNQSEINKDLVAELYGLIVTMADSHSKIFIDNLKCSDLEEQKISLNLFNSILKCTNLPGTYPVDESSSTLTFGFWYTLQDEVMVLKPVDCAQMIPIIKPYYRDLVYIMLRKSMYPSIIDDTSWSLDDKEVFRCYRQDIADTFMYCYLVLNLEMLDILYGKLNESLKRDFNNGMPQQQQQSIIIWNEVETVLHALAAISENIECDNFYLTKVFNTVKEIPYAELNIKVMESALELIGSYAEWFKHQPNLIGEVLPLVLSSLSTPRVSTSATMALKEISLNCLKYLTPYADHIIITSNNAFQNSSLNLAECRRLMYSVGRVLSIMPVDKVIGYLNVILAPTFEQLQKLVHSDPTPAIATSLVTKLKIMASLFSSLQLKSQEGNIDEPILIVMQNVMPLYRTIGEKYCRNQEVINELSLIFKHVVSTLKDNCKVLINDILQLIVMIYREYPQANVLNVARTVLILFSKEEQFASLNQQLLYEIVDTTLQMCTQYSNQLSDKADVLEGFFTMLAQLTKKVPQLINNQSVNCSALFQCAILCLMLPEIQTLKAVSSFLVHYICQSRETSPEVVQAYGESLVLRILMNLGTTAPRSSVDIFGDIILILNKHYCDNLSRWLNSLLSQDGFPSHKISRQQKEYFIQSVLREKVNRRRLCDTILEFNLICKGILKTNLDSN